MARATRSTARRSALALLACAILFALAATAAAESDPSAAPVDETAAVGESTSVASGRVVSLSEGVGVDDGTAVRLGRVATLGEGVAVDDGTAVRLGRVVNVGEGLAVGDGTDAHGANLLPLVNLAPFSGLEGTPAVASGSFQDPDAQQWTATVDYGDGSSPTPLALAQDKSFALSHVYDDDGSYQVTVAVRDNAGGVGSAVAVATIANVAPTAVLANNGPVDEGSAATVSFSAQHDPSHADVAAGFAYQYACDGSHFAAETTNASATCTFPDNGIYTVHARIADKDGGSTEYTTDVAVGNVAPTAVLQNNGPVDEGAPATISVSGQADPSSVDTAAGFSYRYACDGQTFGAPTQSASATCVFDEGPSQHTVLARISDKDGASTDLTTLVVVRNGPPSGLLGNNGPILEGGTATIAWTGQTDPSPADSLAGFTYRYACDGQTLGAATQSATATCTFDDGPSTHTVLARITDRDGGSTDRTTDVVVQNVAPDGTLGNNGPVDEGGQATITWTAQADPSTADTTAGFTYQYACDGQTLGQPTPSPTVSCTFDDGPSQRTVLARISDKDGGFTDHSTVVAVRNVAPDGALANSGPVNEASPVTVTWSSQTDPSSADRLAGFSYQYACDGQTLGAPTASSTATCTFDDGPATRTVRSRIIDKDGGSTERTTTITVKNVAPTATFVVPTAITNEGSTFTLALQNGADPSQADTVRGLKLEYDCGGGAGYQASPVCTAIDNPSQPVKGRITDKDGGSTEYTGAVQVANVAPTATITAPPAGALYQVGQPITFTGSFTDPGVKDTHTAQWSFDAIVASGSVTETNGSGSTSVVKSFTTPGVYSVRLTITDKDGAVATATTVNGLEALVVVYDPSAGFVTGGGWLTSPLGAYRIDPFATGKATFGFVAKYQKGANAPTGETEFQFTAAQFNFRSTSYDWLVVAGTKAQYKGLATVNGNGGYGFMLTAGDGTPDTLRLKVWDAAGTIVYDNVRGAPDDIDAASPQALGGGSIVIHR